LYSTVVKSFRSFAVTAAALAFLLAILGSWVRINGAGMTCPDWPLCHGALVPSLQGGVILEWSHRLVALVEGLVLIGAIITGWQARRVIAGVTPVLAVLGVIFAVQVGLGGLTVMLSNSPPSVVWHWGVAMALLADLTVLATLSVMRPAHMPRISAAAGALSVAAIGAFVTMAAGSFVSSSGAGLACPVFPGCADHFWGIGPLQVAQMMHRACAFTFALVAIFATALAATRSPRARAAAIAGLSLVCLQIALGIANIAWQMPIAMREAHAANAILTFIVYVIAATMAAVAASAALAPKHIPTVRGEVQGTISRVGGMHR
jgi:heme A synthase